MRDGSVQPAPHLLENCGGGVLETPDAAFAQFESYPALVTQA